MRMDSVLKYCENLYRTERRKTRTVVAGPVNIGSDHPITLQTMTTTDTRDVDGTVEQVMKCHDAGADLVRLTVQVCILFFEKLFFIRSYFCLLRANARQILHAY